MKFLIIAQDLRVSGTSEGIVSRSFLAKLKKVYPESKIEVLYLCTHSNDDNLQILPVNSLTKKIISTKIPFHVKWINRFTTRMFNILYAENYIYKKFTIEISKIDYTQYDHIMVRSAGLNHETILGMHNLPILQRTIVNFHDPYPYAWYSGKPNKVTRNEMKRLQKMIEVVQQAKACCASAYYMAKDLQYLFVSDKYFYTIPHQFDDSVFDFSDVSTVLKKNKKLTISYHGAIQFGRNADILLDAYQELLESDSLYRENTEFVLRLNGQENQRLRTKYSKIQNISILDTVNFSNSSNEQMNEADITIILENGPLYCNILVGKAPFLAAIKKPILSISPERSEVRRIITDSQYIASCTDKEEIKQKLEELIVNRMNSNAEVYPCGDYFSDENFKVMLDKVLF
jgi:hypothetical protein